MTTQTVQEKGIIWFNDGSGHVYKARLLNYDPLQGAFWTYTSRECPDAVDVVVILKNGELFPDGSAEWCGRAQVINRERFSDTPEGFVLVSLLMIR